MSDSGHRFTFHSEAWRQHKLTDSVRNTSDYKHDEALAIYLQRGQDEAIDVIKQDYLSSQSPVLKSIIDLYMTPQFPSEETQRDIPVNYSG